MLRKFLSVTVLVVVLTLAPLSSLAAAAAPVEITNFDLTPDCIVVDGIMNVAARLSNTTIFVQNTWVQIIISYNHGQFVRTSQPFGPFPIPPLIPISINTSIDLPPSLPPGPYTVTGTIGPSATDADAWDSASDSVTLAVSCATRAGR